MHGAGRDDECRRSGSKLLFVCLWTYNPHYPFEAPDELVAHYQGKEGPGLKNPRPEASWKSDPHDGQ